MVKLLLFCFALAMLAVAARWYLPVGPARALSGDMLEVGRQRITLYGIETGGGEQFCGCAPCAGLARQALADLVADRYVLCLPYDRDEAGIFRGVCWAGTTELNEAMVRSGLAVSSPRGGVPYRPAEESARERARGVWDVEREPRRPEGPRVPLTPSNP